MVHRAQSIAGPGCFWTYQLDAHRLPKFPLLHGAYLLRNNRRGRLARSRMHRKSDVQRLGTAFGRGKNLSMGGAVRMALGNTVPIPPSVLA